MIPTTTREVPGKTLLSPQQNLYPSLRESRKAQAAKKPTPQTPNCGNTSPVLSLDSRTLQCPRQTYGICMYLCFLFCLGWNLCFTLPQTNIWYLCFLFRLGWNLFFPAWFFVVGPLRTSQADRYPVPRPKSKTNTPLAQTAKK